MIRRPYFTLVAIAAIAAIAVSACSPSESPAPSGSPAASAGASPGSSPGATGALTTIRVQLPGPIDGEFAGLIAAQKLGYFTDENISVTLLPGDPNLATRTSAFYRPGATGPEITISDVTSVLAAREHSASDLVHIAQLFQRSGTVLLTWAKDDVKDTCGLIGKKIGIWAAPADVEVDATLATLSSCPLAGASNYTRVDIPPVATATQGATTAFLAHTVDAMQAFTYEQLAQVLEATNPATKQQYTPDDVVAMPLADRTATLQDAIFASAAWLQGTGHRDQAVNFVRAVVRGWVYCRDHEEDCVQFTLAATTGLGTSHTRWMINEVNALIWPSPDDIGTLDPIQWQQTVNLAKAAGVITKLPSIDAYDDTIVPEAIAILTGKDLAAVDYKKVPVAVAPGGK
ncbi:MAG: ABC transporter substrate-binding protein [Chloroflexi bacterium]|nr:ABC transporter substrate-binding protein [Chloroflexota bacterium]